jgi:hypothetical protein
MPAPTDTPVPIATPTPLPHGPVIYFDDFGDLSSGFPQWSEPDNRARYVDGHYQIYLSGTSTKSVHQSLEVDDFILDVDATAMTGSSDNKYGVVFRVQGWDDFYAARINSRGEFYMERHSTVRGDMDLVSGTSDAIRPMGSINRLTVVCRGPEMSFYVNGRLVATGWDDVFLHGGVGIRATATSGNIDVYFDNFYVYALSE